MNVSLCLCVFQAKLAAKQQDAQKKQTSKQTDSASNKGGTKKKFGSNDESQQKEGGFKRATKKRKVVDEAPAIPRKLAPPEGMGEQSMQQERSPDSNYPCSNSPTPQVLLMEPFLSTTSPGAVPSTSCCGPSNDLDSSTKYFWCMAKGALMLCFNRHRQQREPFLT